MSDFPAIGATVALDNDVLNIIDQTLLPTELKILRLKSLPEIWEAIKSLRVRGAPAIGVTAAFAMYLAARQMADKPFAQFKAAFVEAAAYLNSSRPTAVNLSWALAQMRACLEANSHKPVGEIIELLKARAMAINDDDIRVCQAIGRHGLGLLRPGDGLLTHCNAGRLATIKYGTATAPMYLGHEMGYNFKIYVDETRPLLQGARLTAFELMAAGLDVTLICDNMAASILQQGGVRAVLVGCDRVAANGDAANKIGTMPLAIAAAYFKVPVYFCAPTSSIDMNTATGSEIAIELRPGEEITSMWYKRPMAPSGCKTYNPAFDVTSHELISAFITEYGVVYPPFARNLAVVMEKKLNGASF